MKVTDVKIGEDYAHKSTKRGFASKFRAEAIEKVIEPPRHSWESPVTRTMVLGRFYSRDGIMGEGGPRHIEARYLAHTWAVEEGMRANERERQETVRRCRNDLERYAKALGLEDSVMSFSLRISLDLDGLKALAERFGVEVPE